MKKKTLYWTLAASLQIVVSLANPRCISAANFSEIPVAAWKEEAELAGKKNSQGWQQLHDRWYFFQTDAGATTSHYLVGWHWIDGYCYYFSPSGIMYENGITPDGYQVNESGAWLEDGQAVCRTGVGISTRKAQQKSGGGSTGGGGGSGSKRPSAKPVDLIPEIPVPEMPVTEMPITDDGDMSEAVDDPAVQTATPSEAREISWEVRFVDAQTRQERLLPTRSGNIQEGSMLLINYMERITAGHTQWEALETSPLEVEVYGPGKQLYYIHFESAGEQKEPIDPYAEEKSQLQAYMEEAKEFESQITGEWLEHIPESRFIVTDRSGNDRRISSIVSQILEGECSVFYVIGKNYKPNGILIAEWFGKDRQAEYSSVTEAVITIEHDDYTVVRMSASLYPAGSAKKEDQEEME